MLSFITLLGTLIDTSMYPLLSLTYCEVDNGPPFCCSAPGHTRSSSIITITCPPSSSCLKITNLVFGVNFLLHSVNLILIIFLHPCVLISPIITLSVTPTLHTRFTFSTNPSHHKACLTHQTAFTDSGLLSAYSYSVLSICSLVHV